ncbi:MAG: hypothetical protein V3S40_00185 [Kiloniellales bacterium]
MFHARLAAVYLDLDRVGEAKAAVQNVLRLDPGFTVTKYPKAWRLHDPAINTWYRDLMLRAGLPE